MTTPTDNPRLILGLKVRRLRQASGRTLSELSAASGLSISYLSEIEKGRKYPKPEKMVALAETLGVPFDELVSLQVTEELSSLKAALGSPLLREFPFDLFGFETGDILSLVDSDPTRAGALFHALLEVGQSFDVDTEDFLLAALRAYQQMSSNHFAEIEDAAAAFRRRHSLEDGAAVAPSTLESILGTEHGYEVDYERLAADPELHGFRSVFVPRRHPRLHVNGDLMPSQRAFVLARELGYATLGLGERALTSSWLEVESFEQVLNNFKASYFGGAVLLDRATVERDMEDLFAAEAWRPQALLAAMERFDATPETYFTRLTQLMPKQFGLEEMFFLRMSTQPDGGVRLTKLLNTSPLPLAAGTGLGEHHCRRWPALALLGGAQGPKPRVAAQRSRFLAAGLDFFVVSTARPLALDERRRSAVTLGWRLDERFRRVARFAADPAVPEVDVNLTCERCPLTAVECSDRVADPSIVAGDEAREAKRAALRRLDD